jgi:CheY-like chemotaxis protein
VHRAEYAAAPRTREMGSTASDLLATRKVGSEFPAEIRLSSLGGGRKADLIITDFHLGGSETGIDAIKRLRTCSGRPLPALLLSGDTLAATWELTQVEGWRVLSKPVNIDQMNEAISGLLELT